MIDDRSLNTFFSWLWGHCPNYCLSCCMCPSSPFLVPPHLPSCKHGSAQGSGLRAMLLSVHSRSFSDLVHNHGFQVSMSETPDLLSPAWTSLLLLGWWSPTANCPISSCMSNRQISPNYQFLGNPGPKNNPGESSQQNADCVATTNDCIFNKLRGIEGKSEGGSFRWKEMWEIPLSCNVQTLFGYRFWELKKTQYGKSIQSPCLSLEQTSTWLPAAWGHVPGTTQPLMSFFLEEFKAVPESAICSS